ncbi:exopolysaccharide biosynthesis polyprenyl glycosylphosphotransferase [Flavimarina sp. Hel_I_48]|uniref:exopolysaccharide biosynthesis polyprenyl glycosylphosphotransferase n=1 Tax=Flavimarina sp. Hel_I_48 TaxID=1392488 RepID=UPI0004DF2AF9|nr:exopolysaccharide biosynthesis polyprenyl glycosylphosphotransferase [Flavimarina sp. Hel_I_48]
MVKGSYLIIPISILVHLTIINAVLYNLTPKTYLDVLNIGYYNISWLVIAYSFNYYPTARKERFLTNIHKLFQLYIVYGLSYFAFFALRQFESSLLQEQLYVFGIICFCLLVSRAAFYYIRSKYRLVGGNFINVVVIGRDQNLKKLREVFDEPDLGYRYKGYFANQHSASPTYLGTFKDSLDYIKNNGIDEIYCTVSQLQREELKALIDFADNNLKKLKIIPDNKEVFTRAMSIEHYGTVPVLNLRLLPLEKEYHRIAKRSFDVVFSFLVLVFVLSWITPLMFILIKLDSKGDLFFKQKRHGVNRKVFWCYKFRSMTTSNHANKTMASLSDRRVTRMGQFLRKTSLDELPQFFNVFVGHMSVVGPRPHMELQTGEYQVSVDKYLVRHFVKPGITGLAQVKGFRGEIVTKADIVNRVRLDIFYLEKWSLLFDIQIIAQTVKNILYGEEKAY